MPRVLSTLSTFAIALTAAVALLVSAPSSAEANPFKGLGHAIKDSAKAGGRALKNGGRAVKSSFKGGGSGARSGAKAGGRHHGGKSHGGRHHHRR